VTKARLQHTAEGYELTGMGAPALFRTRAAFEVWYAKQKDVQVEIEDEDQPEQLEMELA